MQVTEESLELAIEQVRAGNRLFDVCGTVEQHVNSNGFSIVREYVGHGIGTQLHEEPQVPNYVDRKNENPRLKEGMVLAIEPMVNAGKPDTAGVEGQVDGGDEGRVVFGALRALRGGDVERAVGADQAVKKRPGGALEGDCPARSTEVRAGKCRHMVLAHLVGSEVERNFVRLLPGDRVEVELSPRMHPRRIWNRGEGSYRRRQDYESTSIGKEDLRQVQGDPPRRRGAGHLRQSET